MTRFHIIAALVAVGLFLWVQALLLARERRRISQKMRAKYWRDLNG